MQFEKVIDGTVDVANPINFCADKERHLMAELRNKYVGRCFKGAYILGIKAVLDSSACHIVRTNGSGEGYVDVRFLADVAVFSRWDVLTGVEIVSHQQMIVGVYEGGAAARADEDPDAARARPGPKAARAVVTVLASKAVEALAVGQKIAVRVVLAKHAPMQPQASLVGALLVCDQTAPAYRLRGALDQSARAELAPMLAVVELELEARAALIETRKADLWFFELLLYAFREPPGAKAPEAKAESEAPAWEDGPVWRGPRALQALEAGAEATSVLDVVRRAVGGESVPVAGVWSRSLALYRSSPLVAVVRGESREDPGAAAPATWTVVDGTPRAVFAEFLKNILDFLVATRELVEVYNSRELIDKHLNLWSVMRAAQRPAAR
jgi:DNA-directed RNA polymerase subunit E'/Rpb7